VIFVFDVFWTLLNCLLAILHCVFEVAVIIYIVFFLNQKISDSKWNFHVLKSGF